MGLGVFFVSLGNFGLLRFPDVFCRAHALTKAMTMGITLILTAAWIYLGTDVVGVKALIAILFLYTTIPLSGHILALLSFKKNVPRWRHKEIERLPTHDKKKATRKT